MLIRKKLSYILVDTTFSNNKLFFGGWVDVGVKEQGTWAFMRNMSGHIP
jgi:hypothetical protein